VAKKKKVDVVVRLKGGQDTEAVAAKLREAGLEAAAVMDTLGMVTGKIEPNKLTSLQQVEGVASARPQATAHTA
jgi:diphthamide synthase subunit DPH2